ncbi:ATP-binding protein [Candidatus Entotheonella palauensis]|uniref:ATP-binding protein n=1 Tax=Candidatus Entotheonella palauensis TaxID=93172 RepID=UPI0015C4B6D4|nr:AAA family ATPase [Candidatus Entotheonella palauensis]
MGPDEYKSLESQIAEEIQVMLSEGDLAYLQGLDSNALLDALENEILFLGLYECDDTETQEAARDYLRSHLNQWKDAISARQMEVDEKVKALISSGSIDLAVSTAETIKAQEQFFHQVQYHRQSPAMLVYGLSRFVGRHEEIGILQDALAKSGIGPGQVVTIVGEPGIGKSRLIYQFIRYSHQTERWSVLKANSVSYGQGKLYAPVVNLLTRYFRIEDDDRKSDTHAKVTATILALDSDLQEIIPPLLALLNVLPKNAPFWELDPLLRHQMTLNAVKRLWLYESKRKPLLLVVEDLHWVDSETHQLLDELVDCLPTARILLIVSYRPEYECNWRNKPYCIEICLKPLPTENAKALLNSLLGDDFSLDQLKRLMIEKAQGLPLFLEENVHILEMNGILIGERGHYRVRQDIKSLRIPPTISEVLAIRINRLAPDEKRLLQLASVIGAEVPFSLMYAASDMSKEQLYYSLALLQFFGLLYEPGSITEPSYTFKHTLIQEAAYLSMTKSDRQYYHRKVAHILVKEFPHVVISQPERLAQHYTEGNLIEQAMTVWKYMGDQAIKRAAHLEALKYLKNGLNLLLSLPDTPQRSQKEFRFQISIAISLIVTKGYAAQEVGQTYNRAYTLYDSLYEHAHDTSQLFKILHGLSAFYLLRSRLEQAYELASQCLELAQNQPDQAWLPAAQSSLGLSRFYLGDLIAAKQHFDQGVTFYKPQESSRSTADMVTCLSHRAWTLWYLGYPDQALQINFEALELAKKLANPFSRVHALTCAAGLYLLRRERQATHELAKNVIALCNDYKFAFYSTIATIWLGWSLVEQEKGVLQLKQGITAYNSTQAELAKPWFLALLSESYLKLGRIEEGLKVIHEAYEEIKSKKEYLYESEINRLEGELLLKKPSPNIDQAEKCFYNALNSSKNQHSKSRELRAATSLARLWKQQGKREEARELLFPVYNWFTEGFDTADLQEAKVLLDNLAQ